MLAVIGFLLTILILVTAHELGHYFSARICGVKIEEFSIGFGKTIYSKTDSQGVIWKISLIPLGGYVKMYDEPKENNTIIKNEYSKNAFVNKNPWQKLFIILAGPIASYLLGILIFFILYIFVGKMVVLPIVNQVLPNSYAYEAGIKSEDKIIAVDGIAINNFNEVSKIISKSGENLLLTLQRENKLIDINIKFNKNISHKIGVVAGTTNMSKVSIAEAVKLAVLDTNDMVLVICNGLWQLITGKQSYENIHGSLAIANASATYLNKGLEAYMLFIAGLSVNLAVINLLPIPIFDGGQALYIIYELITRRKVTLQLQNILLKIGLVIIIFLIIISTTNDIKKLLFV